MPGENEKRKNKESMEEGVFASENGVGKRADQPKDSEGKGARIERNRVDVSSRGWVDQRRIRQYEDQHETEPRK